MTNTTNNNKNSPKPIYSFIKQAFSLDHESTKAYFIVFQHEANYQNYDLQGNKYKVYQRCTLFHMTEAASATLWERKLRHRLTTSKIICNIRRPVTMNHSSTTTG